MCRLAFKQTFVVHAGNKNFEDKLSSWNNFYRRTGIHASLQSGRWRRCASKHCFPTVMKKGRRTGGHFENRLSSETEKVFSQLVSLIECLQFCSSDSFMFYGVTIRRNFKRIFKNRRRRCCLICVVAAFLFLSDSVGCILDQFWYLLKREVFIILTLAWAVSVTSETCKKFGFFVKFVKKTLTNFLWLAKNLHVFSKKS